MSDRAPDYLISDLGRKLDDDITSCAHRATGLLPNPADKAVLTILGVGRLLGMAVTYFELSMPGTFSAEDLVDALWATRLRATVISAIEKSSATQLMRRAEGR